MPASFRGITCRLIEGLNRGLCRALYRVRRPAHPPLPVEGPVLLVSDHSSYNDPMVLAATAGRPIIFLTAREIYDLPSLRWLCRTFRSIPVNRGDRDVGAVRAALRALRNGEALAIFPEGGIDEHREETGHRGIGYLALKTGAPVVPASIAWDKARPVSLVRSLLTPGRAVVRYGPPMALPSVAQPDRETIARATERVMRAVRELKSPGASSCS